VFLLLRAYPGSPGPKAVKRKRLSVCVCVSVQFNCLESEVLHFVCDVIKDTGKKEYMRPFVRIGLDWIGLGLLNKHGNLNIHREAEKREPLFFYE